VKVKSLGLLWLDKKTS